MSYEGKLSSKISMTEPFDFSILYVRDLVAQWESCKVQEVYSTTWDQV